MTKWYQDGGFLRLLDAVAAYPRPKGELANWLSEANKSSHDILFAIRTLEEDRLLGYVELDGILWNQQVAHVSIAIGERAYWGRGYGADALRLALRFGFDELNLHRVGTTVFSYNTRALALYEKLGFQREGVLREFLHRDGKRYDMYWYGLLRHEWENKKAIDSSTQSPV
jgi:RimJ/RimL family protein N-acetyltransferase